MNQSEQDNLEKSLIIQNQNQNCCMRLLQTVDIFSFIPVPKTGTVSTKCSLIGTAFFFGLFLAYITYDFIIFVTNNPPIANTYFQDLDNTQYIYPNVALTFMWGTELNESLDLSNIYKFSMKLNIKKRGSSDEVPINLAPCQNVNWIDQDTLNFYKNLLCPVSGSNLTVSGLLYASDVAMSPAIKISQCLINSTQPCSDQIANISAGGRVFLFVQRQKSKYDKISLDSAYLIYNFFLVPGVYNRINVLSQVNQQIVMPDYFNRFSVQDETRIQVQSVSELNSNVSIFGISSQALLLSIQFTLASNVKVTKLVYATLIDHIAQWGALWGVEFGVFAIIFLAYNKKKFYKKNPKWDKFDQELKIQTESKIQNDLKSS